MDHKRVLRLTCEENLLRLTKKRFVVTTDSGHWLPVSQNLAAEMDATAPDQSWVSDLTYIHLGHRFIYLAVVRDACSLLPRLGAEPSPHVSTFSMGLGL